MDGTQDILDRKQRTGIAISAGGTLLLFPVTLMKPGPKNKGPCPVDIHLRLPDNARSYLDSLGPSGNQEKIVSIILRASDQKIQKSQIELQSDLIRIDKEIKALTELKRVIKEDLEINCGLTMKQYEAALEEVQKIVYPEDFPE